MQTSKQADVKEAPFCQWKVGTQKGYPFCQKWWPPRVKRFLAPPLFQELSLILTT